MYLNEGLRTSTDEELARCGLDGDEQALVLLYHRFKTRVLRFVLRRCSDEPLAEDVTSQTLEIMIRTLDRFQGRSSLSTWVLSIAHHQLRRALSKSDPESVPLDECYAIPGSAILEPTEITRREDQLRMCRSLLEQLTNQQRETVQMAILEGMSRAEIARLQGRTPIAVRLTLHRAMNRLKSLQSEVRNKERRPPLNAEERR